MPRQEKLIRMKIRQKKRQISPSSQRSRRRFKEAGINLGELIVSMCVDRCDDWSGIALVYFNIGECKANGCINMLNLDTPTWTNRLASANENDTRSGNGCAG